VTTESGRVAFRCLTVDSDTLDIEFTNDTSSGMVIPVRPQSSKMWEVVYSQFMYPTVHKRDRVENLKPKYGGGVKTSYYLSPPPLWLAAIAGVMWEGVLQGAAWDTVKFAVRRALDKLSNEGLVPPPESSSSKERMFRAGWSQ
jgi:hypothetical protein